MVKGNSKATKMGGSSLHLECKDEELSEAQILHRKKHMVNWYLLQEAFEIQSISQKEGDIKIPNGDGVLSALHNLPSMQKNSVDPGSPTQYLQYMIAKKGTETNDKIERPNKRKAAGKISSPEKKKQNVKSTTPQLSLTQTLRATRKTTGTLPPPKVNLAQIDDEPEIEVIQETRITSSGQKITGLGGQNLRPIAPKLPITRNIGKPLQILKPNNLLLLNINVRPRNAATPAINAVQRKELDGKVKVVLMKSPSEFVEWLLKQGLIRSQQFCNVHKSVNRQPTKLKLGMFQDPKILTTSGGYVWIGECCGRKYISVYSGSIFGSTPIDKVAPTSLLKLIYHWSCQTSIANVETWVKVEKLFVSKIYNYLRCICSIILHDKIYDFGYEGTMVELGIVSLGTTTADGTRKAVKVEILGLYDRKNKSYRLFASTPEPASNSRERFLRILKPVKDVIHRNATIICDQSVDPSCLHAMNFSKVDVCSTSDNENDLRTNSTIMYYLRKHVPKMFQAALSQLVESQVQLSLDELCWREKFAQTSAQCFDNIMDNIAYITYRELENPGLIPLLEFVSDFPNKNFRYKNQNVNKIIPAVPASVILPPTNGPPNVIPSLFNETKATSPLQHANKVMTKNIQYPQDYAPKVVSSPSMTAVAIKNLSSLADKITSTATKTSPINYPQAASTLPGPSAINAQSPKLKEGNGSLLKNVELESYFYGRIEGNPSWGQDQNTSVFKCHICSDTFEDNITFYSHLKYHLEGKTVDKDKLDLMCPFCTKSFESINGLNKHKIDSHLMSDLTQLWCRICAEKFSNEGLLKTHMIKKHVEAELPYRCEVCHYATSFYYEIINHFQKTHKGTPYIQCHFCLNVKTITPNGAMSFSTRMYQHMQKHNTQKIPCRGCLLSFYSKYLQNEHRKDHISCSKVNGVVRYESPNGYRTLQFRPIAITPVDSAPTSLPMPSKLQTALSQTLGDFEKVKVAYGDSKFYCIECDAPLHAEVHFKKYRKCFKCPYSTCCPNMIMKHAQIFHPGGSSKPLTYFIGAPIPLTNFMYCLCGFSTKSGHHLARHLALCNKKTAYPSRVENDNYNDDKDDAESINSSIEQMDLEDGLPNLPLSVEINEL